MPKVRKIAGAFALLLALTVNSAAIAAPRDDDPRDLRSRIRTAIARIITILEDVRAGIPP